MNTKDSELLVTGLREIPFRLMARENNIGENMFIERMQRIECPYRFFLQNNCEFHFTAIGNILTAFQTDRIRHRTNENDKKKNKLQLGAIEETSPSSLKSYSDVLVSSARKEYQTTDFLINLNVKFNPVMNRRMAPVLTEQQIRDKWSNKIITGLSEEFKAYQEIEECDLDFKLLHSAFGIYHRSLVDIFLEDFRRDENEIYNEILVPGLKALLEKSFVAGQPGQNYFKTFHGPTLTDFPVLPVPLMPQISPTSSVVSVNTSLNSSSCPNIPRISFPIRSLSMHTLHQKAKIQSQNKRQYNKRFQRITRKK